MINKLLELVLGKAMLQNLSKRLVAYIIALVAGSTPLLAQAGLKVDIDPTQMAEWLVFTLGAVITYVVAETKKPSTRK